MSWTTVTPDRPADPIDYTLRFPAPHTHYVEVEASVPTGGASTINLMMPVWTPGSYLVREYARHVEAVTAHRMDGARLDVARTRKNRWRIQTSGEARLVVRYRVYGREMSVRTNWIESDFAMLNGAATFLTLADGWARPHRVAIDLAAGWATAITALPHAPGHTPRTFVASDFDTLVDSPIVAGNPVVHEFTVRGTPHALVNVNDEGIWDGARAAADVERIVRTAEAMWGSLPYDRYVFLNMITEAGGGLEHASSTLLMTSRWATASRKSYVGWLGLVAHEYFHAWNVKRLRPVELGPFDYENEVYTTSLWVGEGITTYYGDLLVRRAGLTSDAEYLDALSGLVRQLQTTPGRLVQPLADASFDAWIKQYRPDENSSNTSISYYTKGAVIAFLLDARIREATAGARSLDDAMRLAYARYSGAAGYTTRQFRATVEEVAGVDLATWFARALETTEELEYEPALAWLGLRFTPADRPAHERNERRGWLGLETRADEGRLMVSQVGRDTPAYAAGVNVDDEILAIDGYRVSPSNLGERVERYSGGERAKVIVSRRGRLRTLSVTFGSEPASGWTLQPDPDATPDQAARRDAWLAGRSGQG